MMHGTRKCAAAMLQLQMPALQCAIPKQRLIIIVHTAYVRTALTSECNGGHTQQNDCAQLLPSPLPPTPCNRLQKAIEKSNRENIFFRQFVIILFCVRIKCVLCAVCVFALPLLRLLRSFAYGSLSVYATQCSDNNNNNNLASRKELPFATHSLAHTRVDVAHRHRAIVYHHKRRIKRWLL